MGEPVDAFGSDGAAETLTILSAGCRLSPGLELVGPEDLGELLGGDFVVLEPRPTEVGVVATVGVVVPPDGALELEVAPVGEVALADVLSVVPLGDVLCGDVLCVLVVVALVVVVTGGPWLFARTELGGNGGCKFGSAAPNVQASTLPGGGS